MDDRERVAAIAGAGPTIGHAVAERFAAEGLAVALIARSGDRVRAMADALDADAVGIAADLTDPDAVASAFDRIRESLGPIEVLVYNASAGGGAPIEDSEPERFEAVWRTRAFGGYLSVRAALSDLKGTDGTVLFSGTNMASDPFPHVIEWSSAAAATRGFARALAAGLKEEGVSVTYATIAARVTPKEPAGPGAVTTGAVADRYWELVCAEAPPVEVEIVPEEEL